ncbi:MAG: FUSC family protein, partial [Actinomycetota bacterium]|nr:FUSC family protein [Actinomycetota bacterium]
MARLRRPTVAELQVALRAAVSAGLSIVVADALGLKDSYWAAMSAVVATGPTVGASLGAALTRIAATVAGLLVGLAAFAVAGDGTLVAAVAVFAALLVLPAVSLEAGVRLGAATTLIVTAIPGDAFVDALERGANVPLGCALAVAVGLLLWP